MQEQSAREIANAWLREAEFDPNLEGHVWSERGRALTTLIRDALPDLDASASYRSRLPAGAAILAPSVLGVADGALYRVEGQDNSNGGWTGFQVARYAAADLKITLIENLHTQLGGVPIRGRGWVFIAAGEQPFGVTSEEPREGPNVGAPPTELVARAVARAAGWSAT